MLTKREFSSVLYLHDERRNAMTAKLTLGATLAVVMAATWSVDSLARQAAPQGRGRPPIDVLATTTPCVGRETSTECAIYRLDQIDKRLNEMEKAITELRSRPIRQGPSGPRISVPRDPGGKADATTEYLQQRIDANANTVTELVNRVNKL